MSGAGLNVRDKLVLGRFCFLRSMLAVSCHLARHHHIFVRAGCVGHIHVIHPAACNYVSRFTIELT